MPTLRTLLDVLPSITLSLQTSGIVSTDGVAAKLTSCFTYQIPEGSLLAIARSINPLLDLQDDNAGTEMPRETKFGLAFIPAGGDPDRPIPVGSRLTSYANWYGLSTTEQQNADYRDRLFMQLMRSLPLLVLRADDTLVFQVLHATATLDVSECTIELPVHLGQAGNCTNELAWRKAETGW